MSINQKATQLPTTTAAKMSDIFVAVQNYVSSSSPGVSTQETLQQVYNLFQANFVLQYVGNPNGNVAGVLYQLCWDSTNKILYVCNTAGSITTAVWNKAVQLTAGAGITISQSGANITISAVAQLFQFNTITTTSATMVVNQGFIANNASLVTLTLPAVSAVGNTIRVMGQGAGGWRIIYGGGQQIIVGNISSTIGTGNVSSTQQRDGIELVCVSANTIWQTCVSPQGVLSIT